MPSGNEVCQSRLLQAKIQLEISAIVLPSFHYLSISSNHYIILYYISYHIIYHHIISSYHISYIISST
jgi:hypothetical protein